MVDVRSAVVVASEYFSSLQDMIGDQIEDLRLEEAELSEDQKHWFITLGFIRPVDKTSNPLADWMETRNYEREYKVFKIDAKTGEVQSMKIREV
jgi:N-acetylglutamate synthase-like GNAT family acetyltransferase